MLELWYNLLSDFRLSTIFYWLLGTTESYPEAERLSNYIHDGKSDNF